MSHRLMSYAAVAIRTFYSHIPLPASETNRAKLFNRLHLDEQAELSEALGELNRAKIARELADVVYVAYGTARAFNIDLDRALELVHKANMTKVVAQLYDEQGKLLKPPDFQEPDTGDALL